MSEELKPCPHCGGVKLNYVRGDFIACLDVSCGAIVAVGAPWGGPKEDGEAWLIWTWNRRADPAPLGSDDLPQGLRPAGSEGGEAARRALEAIIDADREATAGKKLPGLCDCMDNHGVAYQSAWLAGWLTFAGTIVELLAPPVVRRVEEDLGSRAVPLTFSDRGDQS